MRSRENMTNPNWQYPHLQERAVPHIPQHQQAAYTYGSRFDEPPSNGGNMFSDSRGQWQCGVPTWPSMAMSPSQDAEGSYNLRGGALQPDGFTNPADPRRVWKSTLEVDDPRNGKFMRNKGSRFDEPVLPSNGGNMFSESPGQWFNENPLQSWGASAQETAWSQGAASSQDAEGSYTSLPPDGFTNPADPRVQLTTELSAQAQAELLDMLDKQDVQLQALQESNRRMRSMLGPPGLVRLNPGGPAPHDATPVERLMGNILGENWFEP